MTRHLRSPSIESQGSTHSTSTQSTSNESRSSHEGSIHTSHNMPGAFPIDYDSDNTSTLANNYLRRRDFRAPETDTDTSSESSESSASTASSESGGSNGAEHLRNITEDLRTGAREVHNQFGELRERRAASAGTPPVDPRLTRAKHESRVQKKLAKLANERLDLQLEQETKKAKFDKEKARLQDEKFEADAKMENAKLYSALATQGMKTANDIVRNMR